MQEMICVTGMILKQTPVGEYDRRITILTRERGKISAFAKGARKQTSRFQAATIPFCFGEFKLYEGRSSYTVVEAEIQQFFEELMKDYIGACYGSYFAEIADYYARENNDEREMLKLLYQTMRALSRPSIPKELVRCIYEMRAIMVNGEYPGVPRDMLLSDSARYTVDYIERSSLEKLYTFTVKDEVLRELLSVCDRLCRQIINQNFKSLEILKALC